jgi:hypothetical protein
MIRPLLIVMLLLGAALHLPAADAQDQYKSLPPHGIDVAPDVIHELKEMTFALRRDLAAALAVNPQGDSWRSDVEVFIRAAELAIDQGLFYKPKDTETAKEALQIARARLLAATGGTDAATSSGAKRTLELLAIGSRGEHAGLTLAGGFVSLIDGSVQPYGLVVPADLAESPEKPRRLDIWLHGRGDTTTEIPFLMQRLSKLGTYAPPDTLVLHPFGRHCNAFKFAGETDVYEALQHVARLFAVDPARISIRGFSMGGAGCWHLAAHDPGRWFAANPGAGFVDTIRYQGWDQKPMPYQNTDWGRRLMNWYDVPPWVENLSNTHVIAYSGELDAQRQAAEIMVEAAQQHDIQFPHAIGVGMGHKIDEASADAIETQLAEWADAADGQYRRSVRLVTYTLRYNTIQWLSVQGMKEHWQRAAVTAELVEPATIRLKAQNVDSLRLDFTDRGWPLHNGQIRLEINDQIFAGPTATSDQPLRIDLVEHDGQWYELDPSEDSAEAAEALRKRPGLQGPIDDALTGPFLFVLPSRPCRHGAVERFVQHETQWARDAWQRIMRGDDRIVLDTELTAEQIASHHLICFGDFTGNRYLASIAASLPVRWQDDEIIVGQRRFDASSHALAMVFPNPRNPARYVVFNSGITFREFSNNTNSRQIAMLPDWAVIDVTVPSDGIFPGRIAAADFFDETWQLKPARPQR